MASATGEPFRPRGIIVTMRATQLAAANHAREWRAHA
jgi:hypothetical protein